jgi:formamidopyrimidine-DNA glycosylase
MAERPDLDHAVPILARELAGRRITGVRSPRPIVWRVTVEGDPAALLTGHAFGAITRRAHAVRVELVPPAGAATLELVVEPKLAGRFRLDQSTDKTPGDLAVALALDDGRELRYRDDVQMGKVWILASGTADLHVPGWAEAARALDVLDPARFTLAAFTQLARKRRDQAKIFLMDKAALDAFGNAYADEALHRAGIHPKSAVSKLDGAQLERLHAACRDVLAGAAREIAARQPPLDEKLRDFLAVRGRHGVPSPRCGTTIRKAGVRGHDAFFCPSCQPEGSTLGVKSVVDWRKSK